ncbi:hypothetical protein BDM02DRAFT_977210 [Thelephora ganbajun]|uniref:Uncharacterized protein n=1 Tax=Thelephora ganbajun TaxID=370292 RepID=A0ACB6ZMY2_THEGA|nr:hypothetical protein BDM02DRAFT_977210 [Thelephora ganbajun]
MDRLLQLGISPDSWPRDQAALRAQARQIVQDIREIFPVDHAALKKLISELPSMSEQELAAAGELDSACPICFVPFSAILAEHEIAAAMDSSAHPTEELGITKLSKTCGHIFCRKDIMTWVTTNHRTCPACRTPILTEPDNRPIEEITDAEVSQTLGMIEQLLQGHLEELRVIRENGARPRTERGVGPDGGEEGNGDDEDEGDVLDLESEVWIPGGLLTPERLPSNPRTREPSRSPPQECHGMYS